MNNLINHNWKQVILFSSLLWMCCNQNPNLATQSWTSLQAQMKSQFQQSLKRPTTLNSYWKTAKRLKSQLAMGQPQAQPLNTSTTLRDRVYHLKNPRRLRRQWYKERRTPTWTTATALWPLLPLKYPTHSSTSARAGVQSRKAKAVLVHLQNRFHPGQKEALGHASTPAVWAAWGRKEGKSKPTTHNWTTMLWKRFKSCPHARRSRGTDG